MFYIGFLLKNKHKCTSGNKHIKKGPNVPEIHHLIPFLWYLTMPSAMVAVQILTFPLVNLHYNTVRFPFSI